MTDPQVSPDKKPWYRRVWDRITGGGDGPDTERARRRQQRAEDRIARAGAIDSREAARLIGGRGPFDREGGIAFHRRIMAGEVKVVRANGSLVPVPGEES